MKYIQGFKDLFRVSPTNDRDSSTPEYNARCTPHT